MLLNSPNLTLPSVWLTHARFSTNRPAVMFGDVTLTWGELGKKMTGLAGAFALRGVGKGETVGVLMSNSLEMLTIMCGVVCGGQCLVPYSTLLASDQVALLIAESKPRVLFVSGSARDLLTDRPAGCLLVAVDFVEDGWIGLDEFAAGSEHHLSIVMPAPEDSYNIIYSSGTTGVPKGIVQTHRARYHWSYSNAIEMGFTSESVALVTTALYSNGTMFMVLPPLFVGGTVLIMEKFDVEQALALIQQHQVSHVFMVPTQATMTLDHPRLSSFDLSSLKCWLSAGSALRADTRAKVRSTLTPCVYELYGFSEGFATILKPWDEPVRPNAVGRPVVGFDMRIIDEQGQEVGPTEVGEIVGCGEGMMAGYHCNYEATRDARWVSGDGRDFIRSGDIGMIDEEGFLHLVERKKDMILSGGFNVFPADIEAVVAMHPSVQDVAVIGIPHSKWGETPLAIVIPRPGADPADILAWANERLAKTQRLAAVELHDDLPRNALGKVLKKILREPYWSTAS